MYSERTLSLPPCGDAICQTANSTCREFGRLSVPSDHLTKLDTLWREALLLCISALVVVMEEAVFVSHGSQSSPVGAYAEHDEGTAGYVQSASPCEQDMFLPIANISRIMKRILPANAKIAKEAKESLQECVTEYIGFITSEANDKCLKEKRKTINGDDLIWAMTTLGFENYVEPLKVYLHRYRELEGDIKVTAGSHGGSELPFQKDESGSTSSPSLQH